MQLLAEECTVDEIADRLHIKPRSVRRHIERMHLKTGRHTNIGVYRCLLLQGCMALR